MFLSKLNSSAGHKGFTLIELLIAMAAGGILLTAAFTIFNKQQEHYTAQLDVTVMQQNIRAALNFMTRDIRMAGYDAYGLDTAEIVNAKPDLFHFTLDLNEDGDSSDAGENIAYDLYTPAATGRPTLGRTSSPNEIKIQELPAAGSGHWEVKPATLGDPVHQPAAENIEHLEFYYRDKDGNPTTDVDEIRSVIITVVARADQPDPNFHNVQPYKSASGVIWAKDDNFRRTIQFMTVECRNIGL